MNTSFSERMVGPVHLARPGATHVDLPDRSAVVGDDIVDLALRSAGSGSQLGPPEILDLDALALRIESEVDARDGFRADVVGGWAIGLDGPARRPVLAGFADLLFVAAPGERRMYYRLFIEADSGLHVVEGIKIVRGSIFSSWRQTTTLYTRVSRLDGDLARVAAMERPGRALEGAAPVAAGVLRIRAEDLIGQVASMRGHVPRFLVGFGRRLLGAELSRAKAQGGAG